MLWSAVFNSSNVLVLKQLQQSFVMHLTCSGKKLTFSNYNNANKAVTYGKPTRRYNGFCEKEAQILKWFHVTMNKKTFTQSLKKRKYVYLLPLCKGVIGFKPGEVAIRDKLPWGDALASLLIVLWIRGTQTYRDENY